MVTTLSAVFPRGSERYLFRAAGAAVGGLTPVAPTLSCTAPVNAAEHEILVELPRRVLAALERTCDVIGERCSRPCGINWDLIVGHISRGCGFHPSSRSHDRATRLL